MMDIKASTVQKSAAKSKFAAQNPDAIPSHKDIILEAKKEGVHHDERLNNSLVANQGLNNKADFLSSAPEINTYYPNFPLDRVVMISQPRKKLDLGTCVDLAKSATSNTQDGAPLYEHPVTAWYRESDKKMVIKNGHRRTTGAMECNWETINLIVVEKQSEPERSFDQVIDNIQVESMDAFDVAFQFNQWHEELGYSYSEIAKKLSISKTSVSNYITLAKMPRHIIDFGLLYLSDDVGAYVALSKLYKLDAAVADEFIVECTKTEIFSRKLVNKVISETKVNLASGKKSVDNNKPIEQVLFEKPTFSDLKNAFTKVSNDVPKDAEVWIETSNGSREVLKSFSIEDTENGLKVVICTD